MIARFRFGCRWLGCVLAMMAPAAQASGMLGLRSLAFEGNPLLQSQTRLVAAAQADVKGAQWQFYPTPSVSVEQVNASNVDPNYTNRDGRVLTFRLQQPIWTAGRLTAGVSRAEALVAVAQAQWEESRQQLALRTIAAWGEWRAGEQKLLALHESVQTHQRLAALIRRRVETGLSSGQRQLVNLTRVFLRRPRIWLLDEPTASMDSALEQNLIGALARTLLPDDVMVVVTHKPELLRLVSRIVVIANHQIVMDGPRDAVLQKLSAPRQPTAGPASPPAAQGAGA
jgi:Fe-S cluster assembly ATPase SufC